MIMKWVKNGRAHLLMCGGLELAAVRPDSFAKTFRFIARGIGAVLSGEAKTLPEAKKKAKAYVLGNMPKPILQPKMQTWSAGVANFYGRKDGYYVRLAPGEEISVHRNGPKITDPSSRIADFHHVRASLLSPWTNTYDGALSAARAFVRMMNGAQ